MGLEPAAPYFPPPSASLVMALQHTSLPAGPGPTAVLWDDANWMNQAGGSIVFGAALTAALATLGLSYDHTTGIFTATSNIILAVRFDAYPGMTPTVTASEVVYTGSAGGYAGNGQGGCSIPAGATNATGIYGFGITDALVAGDTFHFDFVGTGGETDIAAAALGLTRIR